MTTYDELYSLFMHNTSTVSLMLPRTIEEQYEAIKNGVMLFNNMLRDELVCNDETETISRDLTDDEKLIIAHYIRLTILKNTKTFKNSLFTTFTQEIGLRNINAQVNSLKDDIENEEKTISKLIFNMSDEDIMEG